MTNEEYDAWKSLITSKAVYKTVDPTSYGQTGHGVCIDIGPGDAGVPADPAVTSSPTPSADHPDGCQCDWCDGLGKGLSRADKWLSEHPVPNDGPLAVEQPRKINFREWL